MPSSFLPSISKQPEEEVDYGAPYRKKGSKAMRSRSTDPANDRKDGLKKEKIALKEKRSKTRADQHTPEATPILKRVATLKRVETLKHVLSRIPEDKPDWNSRTVNTPPCLRRLGSNPAGFSELPTVTPYKEPTVFVPRRRRKGKDKEPEKKSSKQGAGDEVVDSTPGMRAANLRKRGKRNSVVLLGAGANLRGVGYANKLLQHNADGEWHPLLTELQKQSARHLSICNGNVRDADRLFHTVELLQVLNAIASLTDAIRARNLEELREALADASEYEGDDQDVAILVVRAQTLIRILLAETGLVNTIKAPGAEGNLLRQAIEEAEAAGGDAKDGVRFHQAGIALQAIDSLLEQLKSLILLFDPDSLDKAELEGRAMPEGVIPEELLAAAHNRVVELRAMRAKTAASERELRASIVNGSAARLVQAIEDAEEAGNAHAGLITHAKMLLATLHAEEHLREAVVQREISTLTEALAAAAEADSVVREHCIEEKVELSQLHLKRVKSTMSEDMSNLTPWTAQLVDSKLGTLAERALTELQAALAKRHEAEALLRAGIEAGTIEALGLGIETALTCTDPVDPVLMGQAETYMNRLEKEAWGAELHQAVVDQKVSLVEALLLRGEREKWSAERIVAEARAFMTGLSRTEMEVQFDEEGATGLWGSVGWCCNPQWHLKAASEAKDLKVWVTMTPLALPKAEFGFHVVRNQGELLSKTCPTAAAGCEVVGTHKPAWRGGKFAPLISTDRKSVV